MGYTYHPRRLDWPSLRDPKDGWILDLACASGADYIVSYDQAVQDAGETSWASWSSWRRGSC